MQKDKPFPLLVYMMTFLANWYGHLCMIGAYPIAMASGVETELATFYRISGFINFVIFLVAGVCLTIKKTKRETKYYAATFIYLALGTLIFGVILGETNLKTIYKTEQGKEQIINLYDSQLSRLNCPWKDVYVDTSFGRTHIVETGDLSGEPLLVFHGGNATTAYNLLACGFLMDAFHIYAVDMVGHPGKSAETSLPAKGYDYGIWVGEVIDGLRVNKISLFGGSFGAGVIAKTMCVCPDKVKRVVLYVPSGIKNALAIKSASMMLPMIAYWITGKDKWLKKCMLPMAVTEDNITDDIYETAKLSIDHIKVKKGMPSNVDAELMKKCKAPTLIMAAEKDCLFPGKGVIERAQMIIPNCSAYLLKGRGHMNILTDEEKKMIVDFLLG